MPRKAVDALPAIDDIAAIRLEQAGDHVEHGRFPAARRPDDADEIAFVNIEGQTAEDVDRAEFVRKRFADIA
ncbi:hypothetical protein HDG34_004368 [Paraburkholderia sp. HC6.4b]|nr:hypothetical protein [Paraburkholderia sp. HC6.4b]MBB5452785.1 hypothetical protein [Paraburkholderia sp. Kb1A]